MTISYSGYLRSIVFALVCLPAVALVTSQAWANEDDARQIFKSMSDYLANQKTISATYDSDVEVITPDMEKIQFTSSGSFLLSRPSAIHMARAGGYTDVELFFDGKTVSLLAKSVNKYAQMDAPGTIDDLIDTLRDRGMTIPGADLLLSDVYTTLMPDVLEAKYIGHGVVGGVECDHLAFRTQETDWQIWIERGGNPIPHKFVITSKAVGGAPQFTLVIRDWQTGVATTAANFMFNPPEGAQKLGSDELEAFSDIPPPAPAKGQ